MASSRCPICRSTHVFPKGGPLATLRRTAAALSRLLSGRSRRALSRRPSAGEWAVNEVVSHLADAEIALAFRIRKIASERNPDLSPWDQEAWADGLGYRKADARTVLATFGAVRRANLDVVRCLSPARRRRTGVHPEYGRLRIDQLVEHIADHDLGHLNQIRTALLNRPRTSKGKG